jgi:hypothetical protein
VLGDDDGDLQDLRRLAEYEARGDVVAPGHFGVEPLRTSTRTTAGPVAAEQADASVSGEIRLDRGRLRPDSFFPSPPFPPSKLYFTSMNFERNLLAPP